MAREGVAALWEVVERFNRAVGTEGIARRRAEQARAWMWNEVGETLLAELRGQMAVPDLVDENGDAVAPGLSPATGEPAEAGPGRPALLGPGELVTAVVERTGYRSELLSEGTIEALGRVEIQGRRPCGRESGRYLLGYETGLPHPGHYYPAFCPVYGVHRFLEITVKLPDQF